MWGYRGWRSGSSSLSWSSEMSWNTHTHTHRWDDLWPPDPQSSTRLTLTSYSSSIITSCFCMSIFTEEGAHEQNERLASDHIHTDQRQTHSEWLRCWSPYESGTSSASPADWRPPRTRPENSTEETRQTRNSTWQLLLSPSRIRVDKVCFNILQLNHNIITTIVRKVQDS